MRKWDLPSIYHLKDFIFQMTFVSEKSVVWKHFKKVEKALKGKTPPSVI